MKLERKTKRIIIICVVVYLLTVVGAVLCHVATGNSGIEKSLSVECVKKEKSVSSVGGNFPTVELYFEIKNNGNVKVDGVKGKLSIGRKSDKKSILQEDISLAESVREISPDERKNFKLLFYDKKVDFGGIENFDDLYNADLSELDVNFAISSVNNRRDNAFLSVMGVVLMIPTYLLGALVAGVLFLASYIVISRVKNKKLRIVLTVLFFPFYIIGYAAAHAKTKRKKTLDDYIEEKVNKIIEEKTNNPDEIRR